MTFIFLEHTADARVECRAGTFTGLLETAAAALYALALRNVRCERAVTRVIEAAGGDREEVLVSWLQELLFLLDTQCFVAVACEWQDAPAVHPAALPALRFPVRVTGYVCAPDERAEEVKAVTYHGMEVQDTQCGCMARIVFDL